MGCHKDIFRNITALKSVVFQLLITLVGGNCRSSYIQRISFFSIKISDGSARAIGGNIGGNM